MVARRSWSMAALALSLCACLSSPRATSGLLEGNLPLGTLASPGDLGFDGLAFPVKQVRLGSGMRVVIEKAPTRGMVAVVLTVGAGASNDPAGKEGLAHFAEHLVFRSRPVKDAPTIGDRLSLLGDAVHNAHTDPDLTTFEAAVPKRNLSRVLETFALMLEHPIEGIDDETAATEREVVESEYLLRDETGVSGQVNGWLHQALFAPNHPYARAIGGTAESASRLSVDEVRAFAQQHYRPSNATLVLVGDFESDEVAPLIEGFPRSLAGDADVKEPARMPFVPLPPLPPPAPAGGPEKHQAAVDRSTVLVAWRLPNVYGPTGGLVRIVTSPAGAPPFARWLERDPDVLAVGFRALNYRQATILVCEVQLANTRRRDAIAQLVAHEFSEVWRPRRRAVVEKLADERGVWAYQVARDELLALAAMRQQTAAGVVFGAEGFWTRAVDRARYLHLTGDHATYTKTMGQVVEASMEDVATFASKHLPDTRARVIYLDPLPADQRPRPALPGADRRDIGQVADKPFAAPVFGAPPRAPTPPELKQVRTFHLDNGLEVALVPRPGFPVVTVAMGYNGGSSASRPPAAGVVLRYLETSVNARDRFNAVVVESHDQPDLSFELVRAGKRNLPNALMLLAMKLKVGDEVPWSTLLEKKSASREDREELRKAASAESPSWRASRTLSQQMYGEHPYGHRVSREEIEALTTSDMERWVLQSRSPRNVVLVIAGDVEIERARALVQQWFGEWEVQRGTFGQAVPPVPAPQPGPAHEQVFVYDEPQSTQTNINVACRLPNGGAREDATYSVLSGYVGGFLSTRIREEAGAAYAILGGARVLRGGASHLQIGLSVDNVRLKDVMRILQGHWHAFGQGQFDPGALSQVKWHAATRANFAFQTSGELALGVLDALNHGWAPDHADHRIDDVLAVTTDELAKAFEVCRATTVLTLVGNASAIKSAGITATQ